MAATAFITVSDLAGADLPQSQLAALADDNNKPPQWADASTQEVLGLAVAHGNRRVTNALRGRVPDFTDADVLATGKEAARVFAVWWLVTRKPPYGRGDPYRTKYDEANADLDNLREGKTRIDSGENPSHGAYCTEEDNDPAFMRNADGDESDYLARF
jgi:hypothetical protein